jgi:hypothetical protein
MNASPTASPPLVAALAVASLLAIPLPGFAQAPLPAAAPSGLWWSVGVGAGSLRFQCQLCDTGRDTGPTVEVAVGSWASRSLRFGLDGGVWTFDDDGVREKAWRAGLVGQLYPAPERGLHLIGGVGWTGWRAEDFNYDAVRVGVGAGWDLPAFGEWSLGNAVMVEGAAFGSLKNEDQVVVQSVGMSQLRFTVFVKHR